MKRLVRKAVKAVIVDGLDRRLRSSAHSMLIVYGHMRSGSSLLVHILNTNEEIIGYGETHFRYSEPRDFAVNAFDILRTFSRFRLRERYVLDKVLVRRLGPSPELLLSRSTKLILLARRPEDALPSILNLGLSKQSTPGKALSNYAERLDDIVAVASALPPSRWTFVRYEDLVDSPQNTLQRLSGFLDLSRPLSREYDLMWSTGRRHIGDPSPVIETGRIVDVPSRYDRVVPESVIGEGRKRFDACVATLERLSGMGVA